MVGTVTSSLQYAVVNAVTATPRSGEQDPNVAQTITGDDFPPKSSSLVFTPAAQGRFANTESFIAVAQSATENSDVFGNVFAVGTGNTQTAQNLTQELDRLAQTLDIEA